MSVSVIIVNYNTKELLLNCISSIYKQTYGVEFEIIVVDNNSNDGSIEAVSLSYPLVKCVKNSDNLGFGTANNIGVRYALYDYVFLLNSDTIIEQNILSELEYFMNEHTTCAGVIPNILYPDYTPQCTYGNYPTFIYFFLNAIGIYSFLPKKMRDKYSIGIVSNFKLPTKVPHILGVAMFMKKSIFEYVLGFDEKYFLYFEETDLCYRITKLGYDFYVYPFVYVLHYLSKSSPSSIFKIEHTLKSRIYYFRKNKVWGRFGIKTISFLKLVLLSIKNRDCAYLGLIKKIGLF